MPQLDVDFRMKFFRLNSGALRVTFTRLSPGEISLAHRGVLSLDELSEFKPSVLDAMREPFEFDEISDSRANYSVNFSANFQL